MQASFSSSQGQLVQEPKGVQHHWFLQFVVKSLWCIYSLTFSVFLAAFRHLFGAQERRPEKRQLALVCWTFRKYNSVDHKFYIFLFVLLFLIKASIYRASRLFQTLLHIPNTIPCHSYKISLYSYLDEENKAKIFLKLPQDHSDKGWVPTQIHTASKPTKLFT